MPANERHPRPRPAQAGVRRPVVGQQVGRRPPNPYVPMLTGAMWVVVGVIIVVSLTADWRWVAGIVCIGVGLLFLRGGVVALIRQDNRATRK